MDELDELDELDEYNLEKIYKCEKEIVIVLIHGLGAGPYSLYLLKKYLQNSFPNTLIVVPKYDTSNITSTKILLDRADIELSKYISKESPIIIIGQSMGGIVAMNIYEKKWNVLHAISVGSPLHGSRLLLRLRKFIPMFNNGTFKYLGDKCNVVDDDNSNEKQSIPPHSYKTISCSLFNSKFDRCVFADETTLEPEYHIHLNYLDHVFCWFHPKLFKNILLAML
jgi:hypothetical protein